MIPWNPEATAQDHLAAAREGLPCEDCGGAGWFFGGAEYPIAACATCNDEVAIPLPLAIYLSRLSHPPEPWTEIADVPSPRHLPLLSHAYYECAQCGLRAELWFLGGNAGWWACRCLAAAETAAGMVLLKFPQPVRFW